MKGEDVDIYNEKVVESLMKNIHIDKDFNKLIEEHSREIKLRIEYKKEEYLHHLPNSVRWKLKGRLVSDFGRREVIVLDINTSDKTRNKAYRIINTFIAYISKLGGNVCVDNLRPKDNIMVNLLGSQYKCAIYEYQIKQRDTLEIQQRKMRPLYEKEYNGNLCFEIYENIQKVKFEENWYSFKKIDINKDDSTEIKIADILKVLREDAMAKKLIIDEEIQKQDEKFKKELEELEEEQYRKEHIHIEEKKKEKEQKIRNQIEVHMSEWESICRAQRYIIELRNTSYIDENEKEIILRYCDYVENIYSKFKFYENIILFMDENPV